MQSQGAKRKLWGSCSGTRNTESDLIKQMQPDSLHTPHREAWSTSSIQQLEYNKWISTNSAGELSISLAWFGIWGRFHSKRKKVKFYFPFLNVFAAAMPFLHMPEELKVSRVRYNCIFSIHGPRPSRCLCAGSGSGADGASPAGPARCRVPCQAGLAPAAVSSKTWRETCTKVYVFCRTPLPCLVSAAGRASGHREGAGMG